MKKVVAVTLLACAPLAAADVLVVNIWDPMPGHGSLTFQYGQEARSIQEKLGAQVIIGADMMGRMHYGMGFPSWAAWAEFDQKLDASEDWAAFLQKISEAPSATLEDQYWMDQPAPGAVGKVYQVFIWQPDPGRGAETLKRGMEAKGIHEKAGASVGVNIDRRGRLHYVMSFDSWSDWGKFQDTPNEAFQKFVARNNEDPSAELVKVYTAQQL